MSIAENLSKIQTVIKSAGEDSNRDANHVHLVAVSKKQPDERIEESLKAGHRLYGENRVQEAQERWADRRSSYPDLKLHLVGSLQTNKVKDAVSLFDVIETVDREKLARALADEMAKQGKDLPCFIQVNTGEEEQKSGVFPAQLEELYNFCYRECGLNIIGLMCIPPADDPPALHFALLKKYADQLGLKELSMGMSSDFETAISLGATYVRVGTGVFGERPS